MNQSELIDIAAAIADGAPIDWDALGSPAASPDLALPARIVERIARMHSSLPSADSFTSSLHRSLAGVALPGDLDAPTETPLTWGTLTIVEKIGRGTFGDVYRAHDRRLNRTVALKLLRRKDRLESAVIDEGQVMARVRHPNVVTVYGAERIEGRVGLWMQFVDGHTLEDELKTRGPFTPGEVAQAGIQLAQALAAVHGAGLLHRDVKAQNAMRDADGRVLLTDFGTGHEVSDGNGGRGLAGTPTYMAPEVLEGGHASVASDVYSLGVLLYHLATGSFPVRAGSLRQLHDAHSQGNRLLTRQARPDMPKRLAAVIDRATDPDPERRQRSAAELEAALVTSAGSRKLRAPWVAAAAVVVAAISVFMWPRWSQPVAPAPSGPRDLVLVSRFENSTGETTFDGGIEFAIARELGDSDVIDAVPATRVIDVLQMMKKPVDTVVDKIIGREVCLRDGIKAFIGGRVDKTSSGYQITAELIDPVSGSIVASVTETAAAVSTALPTVRRQARRLGELFRERQSSLTGPPPIEEQVTTTSLAALRLYNEALRAHQDWRMKDSEQLLRQAVTEDPNFGGAWLVQAFVLKQTGGPEGEIAAAAENALALAGTAPEWEARYIRGVVAILKGDDAGSVPELEAVVRLRPDFVRASRFLRSAYLALDRPEAAVAACKSVADQRPTEIAANYDAVYTILRLHENPDEARPYVERLDELLTAERSTMPQFYRAAQWRRMLPAYEAWRAGDIAGVQAIVDREAGNITQWPEERRRSMHGILGHFYQPLGRLRDAEKHVRSTGNPWDLMILGEARDDLDAFRRHLLELPAPIPTPQVAYRFVKAGLVDQARASVAIHSGGVDEILDNIGRGAFELTFGNPDRGVRLMRASLSGSKGHFAAEYQNACELFAKELVRLNRRSEAISELERCVTAMPRFFGNFNTAFWMKNQLRLADEYRAVGRIDDAEPVEERLRRLLVFADADNPLVVRLNAR